MNKEPILRRFTERAGLYAEAYPKAPLIEICSFDRVLVENHISVLSFCDCCVDIQMPYGVVNLFGSGFELVVMENERLVIRGKLETISIRRNV